MNIIISMVSLIILSGFFVITPIKAEAAPAAHHTNRHYDTGDISAQLKNKMRQPKTHLFILRNKEAYYHHPIQFFQYTKKQSAHNEHSAAHYPLYFD